MFTDNIHLIQYVSLSNIKTDKCHSLEIPSVSPRGLNWMPSNNKMYLFIFGVTS